MSQKWKQIGGCAIAAFLFVAVQSEAAQEDRAAQGRKLYDCHTDKPAGMLGQSVDSLVVKMEKVKNLTQPPNEKVEEMQAVLEDISAQDMENIAVYLNGLK